MFFFSVENDQNVIIWSGVQSQNLQKKMEYMMKRLVFLSFFDVYCRDVIIV